MRSYLKSERATIQNDKVLDVLMKLGLTELQAKTYLTLTRFGEAEVKKVSEVSKIARQDLYRIIPTLEKLGLVEKIVATPILYRAIPLSEGTSSLFQKRSDEHENLKNSLKLLITQPEENSDETSQEESSNEFVITSERKRLVAKLEKMYSESTATDIMLPGNAINFMIFHFYESLSTALSNGAKIRVIAQHTDIHPATAQKLEKLRANKNFEIKFVNSTFDFGMAISKNKEVNIAISNKEIPSLWTNNRQVLKISQMTFDNEWNTNSYSELICKNEADPLRIKQ